ncbi:hypothetical protein HRbin06_00035 [archaeon HR06]|nr:hypothetical protein HRbin06_00035 [archaeon HR06]
MVVKLLAKAYPKEGMKKEEFKDYWLNKHAPLAKRMPKLRKYVISIVENSEGEEPGYQGIAELWFDSLEDMRIAFNSPEGKKAVEDVKNFCRKVTTVTLEEHVII